MKKKLRKQVKVKHVNYGLILDKIQEDHYIFGAGQLGGQIIQLDGQWDSFLPSDEFQNRNGVESYACTSYGTLHCLSILAKRLYNL